MATVHVTLLSVQQRTYNVIPVPQSAPVDVETLTSSGSSAAGTQLGALGLVWSVTASGGKVWVNFGTGTPVAVSGAGHLILDGQTRDFSVTTAGEKIAVKDA